MINNWEDFKKDIPKIMRFDLSGSCYIPIIIDKISFVSLIVRVIPVMQSENLKSLIDDCIFEKKHGKVHNKLEYIVTHLDVTNPLCKPEKFDSYNIALERFEELSKAYRNGLYQSVPKLLFAISDYNNEYNLKMSIPHLYEMLHNAKEKQFDKTKFYKFVANYRTNED